MWRLSQGTHVSSLNDMISTDVGLTKVKTNQHSMQTKFGDAETRQQKAWF